MSFNVTMIPPELPMGRCDVVFTIREDNEKIGALHISKGAAVWFPVNAQKGYKVSWHDLGEFMEKNGKKCEKRQ